MGGTVGLLNVYLKWEEQRKAKVYQATLSPYEHDWTKIRTRGGETEKKQETGLVRNKKYIWE